MSKTKSFRITDTEAFGLAWNCAIRTAADEQDVDVVGRLYDSFGKSFGIRTMTTAVRDTAEALGYSMINAIEKDFAPAARQKMNALLVPFWKRLTGLMLERNGRPGYMDLEEMISNTFCNADKEIVAQLWEILNDQEKAQKNGTAEKSTLSHEIIVDEKNIPDVNRLAVLMIRYSWGRHTYMPDYAECFVRMVMPILTLDTKKEIRDFINSNNERCNVPETMPPASLPGDFLINLARQLDLEINAAEKTSSTR